MNNNGDQLLYQGKTLTPDNVRSLMIEWLISDKCNLRCSYCLNPHRSSDSFDTHRAKRIVDAIKAHTGSSCTSYKFKITGGEPTLIPIVYVLEYIRNVLKNVKHISIYTNGTASIELYQMIAKACEGIGLSFVFSVHPGSTKIHKLLRVVSSLAMYDNVTSIIKTLLLFPVVEKYLPFVTTKFQEVPNCKQYFSSIRNNNGIPTSSHEELIAYNKHVNLLDYDYLWDYGCRDVFDVCYDEAIATGLCDFKNMYCCGSRNMLTIDSQGYCASGFCNQYKKSIVPIYAGPLEAIVPGFGSPMLCKQSVCMYPNSLVIPKFINEQEAFRLYELQRGN